MFRILCDPSSGSTELCLTEITRGDSQIFFVCLVDIWQRNFEHVVCAYGTAGSQPAVPYAHTTGSKLRCQISTKHTKNICESPRVI